MHPRGHTGLALFICSLIAMLFGLSQDEHVLITILLTAGLSSISDIDLNLGIKHRGFTHSILFSLILGTLLAVLFTYALGSTYRVVGFLAGSGAVVIHILGDVMTCMKFKPIWPFSNREISLAWFHADNRVVNNIFFWLGAITFLGYVFMS